MLKESMHSSCQKRKWALRKEKWETSSKPYNLWALILHRSVPKLPREFGIKILVRETEKKKTKERGAVPRCSAMVITWLSPQAPLPLVPLALSKVCLPPLPVPSSITPVKVSENTIFKSSFSKSGLLFYRHLFHVKSSLGPFSLKSACRMRNDV